MKVDEIKRERIPGIRRTQLHRKSSVRPGFQLRLRIKMRVTMIIRNDSISDRQISKGYVMKRDSLTGNRFVRPDVAEHSWEMRVR